MAKHSRSPFQLDRPTLALLFGVALVALLVTTGCTAHHTQPFGPDRLIPPDQSRSSFTSNVTEEDRVAIMDAAQRLSCNHPLGCTCFLDGIQASCAFVFSCIDAGACECVSGCGNISRD
jgi:hypothetical protein